MQGQGTWAVLELIEFGLMALANTDLNMPMSWLLLSRVVRVSNSKADVLPEEDCKGMHGSKSGRNTTC